MLYVFDSSWKGLLTAVFDFFDRKEKQVQLIASNDFQPPLFGDFLEIVTDEVRALRVKRGLEQSLNREQLRLLYCVFLSELPSACDNIFQIVVRFFSGEKQVLNNYGDPAVLFMAQTAKKVEREKHRMKAFVRFEKAHDGLFFCRIEPDFNVLPLIKDFFQKRYADQPWLIYDVKRDYGLHYNLLEVNEVVLACQFQGSESNSLSTSIYDIDEDTFAALWQDYFKSTNIAARRNIKLHLQHVPKRYWKHLTEKRDVFL